METVLVSRTGRVLGQIRHDPSTDQFDPDPSVPRDVVSDIILTYYRDNVLFGQNRDGYVWDACMVQPARCPLCGKAGS